jgi:hypothetical protein
MVYGRAVKELLPPAYTVKERGKVTVKGKGEMLTYWVESKANRIPPTLAEVRIVLTISTTFCARIYRPSSCENKPKSLVLRIGLVFAKTGSINSGTVCFISIAFS